MRRSLTWLGRATAWTAIGVSLGVLAATAAPLAFGGRSLTVMSGSMEPAIATGDVIVAWPISPLEAKIGDVVTFVDHEARSRLITHRVRQIRISNGTVRFVTKGDSNTTVERWALPEDATLGRVVLRLPKLGYPLSWLGGPRARIGLIVLVLLLFAGSALVRIWRPRVSEGYVAAAPDPGVTPTSPAPRGERLVSEADVLLGSRLRLLSLADEIGVGAACRAMGVHRSTYYRWKRRVNGSVPSEGRPHMERLVIAFALGHPTSGPKRISVELGREKWGGLRVSPSGVWRVLRSYGVNTSTKRLALIDAHAALCAPSTRPT